jgi:hypothetical protein
MFTANVGVLTDAHAGLEDDYIECIRKIGCHPVEGECTEDLDSKALKANIIKETKDATWDLDVGCPTCNEALGALRDSWRSFGNIMDITDSNTLIMYNNSLKALAKRI